MTSEPYTYTQDPGHGWIAVSLAELRELGIADQITSYSYTKKGTVYLEEDQDATTWSRAYEAKHGRQPDLVEQHVNSTPIRRYARYEPPARRDYPIGSGNDTHALPPYVYDEETLARQMRERHERRFDESALVFPEHTEQISDADAGL